MEVVVQLLDDGVDDVGAQVAAIGLHVGGAELGLGLAFKDGLLNLHGDGGDDAGADVTGLELLFIKLTTLSIF